MVLINEVCNLFCLEEIKSRSLSYYLAHKK